MMFCNNIFFLNSSYKKIKLSIKFRSTTFGSTNQVGLFLLLLER